MRYIFFTSFILLFAYIISSCNKKEAKENITYEQPSPNGLGISSKRSEGVDFKLEVSHDSIYIINGDRYTYSRLDHLHQNLNTYKEFLTGEIYIVINKNSSIDLIKSLEKKTNEYQEQLLEEKTFKLYHTTYNLLSDDKKKELNEVCVTFKFVFSSD
ncbi:hypothetical protein [Chondrinema litorale]|uniref:hypothetical protein n=1 Tax=Chondrinema litorale TaxID=2994555 RepID=UPI002543E579|nr:hypothetical protein [Chondrinema litorale]UZR98654.1 hypothetical protein OQ292_33025 [Chondrinema litorale]